MAKIEVKDEALKEIIDKMTETGRQMIRIGRSRQNEDLVEKGRKLIADAAELEVASFLFGV